MITAKLHRAEIMLGLRIKRRGREAGSLVTASVAASIFSLSWSFVHAVGLYWSGTADDCISRASFLARRPVMDMLMNVLGTYNSLGNAA